MDDILSNIVIISHYIQTFLKMNVVNHVMNIFPISLENNKNKK